MSNLFNNEKDFKSFSKSLKIELSKINFNLSHGAALNLVSRTIGFADFNTYKAQDKNLNFPTEMESILNLIEFKNINNNNSKIAYIKEFDEWIDRVPFPDFRKIITMEFKENLKEILFINIHHLYLFAYSSIIYEYIDNFLKLNIHENLASVYENQPSDDLLNIAKRINKGSFYIEGVAKYFDVEEESFKKAYDCALKYANNKTILDYSSAFYSQIIYDIDKYLEKNMYVLNIQKFNNESSSYLDDEILYKLKTLKYEIYTAKEKEFVAEFSPITLVNKLSDGNYQIDTNCLLKQYLVDNKIKKKYSTGVKAGNTFIEHMTQVEMLNLRAGQLVKDLVTTRNFKRDVYCRVAIVRENDIILMPEDKRDESAYPHSFKYDYDYSNLGIVKT